MENVNNQLEISNTANDTVDNLEEQISFFKFKQNEGFNETNLMTLPFISLKRNKQQVIERSWQKSNNEVVGLKVVGGEDGVPQITELDVLLALFRIHLKNNKYGFTKRKTTSEKSKLTTKVDIPQRIHFTYFELNKELGRKKWGGSAKKSLEKSIKKLNETTIYNKFAIYDAEQGKYVTTYKGEKSCRVFRTYSSYDKEEYKREKGGILKPHELKDFQYVEIDDFFYNNMCNNYYKIYDYEKYKGLKTAVAKKIFLILSTWSKSNSKPLSYETLTNYIGLDYTNSKEKNYARDLINRAMNELIEIDYIDSFKKDKHGIEIIFNQRKLDIDNYKFQFKTTSEIMEGLRQVNINYEEMSDILNKYGEDYIRAVLRAITFNIETKGNSITNKRQYFLSALENKWDIKQFMD